VSDESGDTVKWTSRPSVIFRSDLIERSDLAESPGHLLTVAVDVAAFGATSKADRPLKS
jgi:hypothetical protein